MAKKKNVLMILPPADSHLVSKISSVHKTAIKPRRKSLRKTQIKKVRKSVRTV